MQLTTVSRNSGGYTMNVPNVPADVQSYDEMAKYTGACVERAVDADFQHNWNGRWRKEFCLALEKETGIERKKEENNGKTKYLETENVYIARVESDTKKKYAELAQTIADTIKFAPQGSGSSSIGESWLSEADTIIAAVGGGSYDGFIANITRNNPGFVFDFEEDGSTPTREAIALALKTEDARAKQVAKASRLALVNG